MRINLISRDNGVGLSTDMALLENLLASLGCDVTRVDWTNESMRQCDVAIYLELYNPALTKYATHTVGIFNLEWFDTKWQRYLKSFTQLWAKTKEAYGVYRRFGLTNHHYTGFLSRDLYRPEISKSIKCFHLRGHSKLKGTEAVMSAWRRYPDLPPLTVVSAKSLSAPPNVRQLGRVSEDELIYHINSSAIHLCPSRAEGWGHYITEAMSAKSVVVTTNASPMSDHIKPPHGLLIPVHRANPRRLVKDHIVTPDALAATTRKAVALPLKEQQDMGFRAREYMLKRNDEFRDRVQDLLSRL